VNHRVYGNPGMGSRIENPGQPCLPGPSTGGS